MVRILFVCLGNICRSPAAEGVFKALVARERLSGVIHVDSAGTGDWHVGDLPDARMRQHASRRSYDLTSRARQITVGDFEDFDLIITMDESNRANVARLTDDERAHAKIHDFCEFVDGLDYHEVPDPYFGKGEGFDLVLDILENGAVHLLEYVKEHKM